MWALWAPKLNSQKSILWTKFYQHLNFWIFFNVCRPAPWMYRYRKEMWQVLYVSRWYFKLLTPDGAHPPMTSSRDARLDATTTTTWMANLDEGVFSRENLLLFLITKQALTGTESIDDKEAYYSEFTRVVENWIAKIFLSQWCDWYNYIQLTL